MSEQEQNINELIKVRRDKLEELRSVGIDPFGQRFDCHCPENPGGFC